MNILTAIYNKLEEVYGAEVAIRALCAGGCALLFVVTLYLKPQQPIIVINETPVIEEKK